MRESLKEYCVRNDRRELLAQWHPNKNGPLSPGEVTSGSKRKVWWRCGQGHEWTSSPYERGKALACINNWKKEIHFSCRNRKMPRWYTKSGLDQLVRIDLKEEID